MSRLTWLSVGERFYEAGLDRGVLYVDENAGVSWNGLVSVDESSSGGTEKAFYLDGVKYLSYSEREEFEGTINAFYSPSAFDVCDGNIAVRPGLHATQQRRARFGLSYRTRLGNDVLGDAYAYKIHLIYNALAEPTQRTRNTISDSSEAMLLSWDIKTKPIFMPEVGYVSHLVVDTSTSEPYAIKTLEDILYGSDDDLPRLPTPEEMSLLFDDAQPLTVTDIGGYMFSIAGSGLVVQDLGNSQFSIDSETVIFVDDDTAQISSE